GGVIIGFSGGGIYFSQDGKHLGTKLYNGSQRVTAMIPYKEGVITGFSGGGIFFSENGQHLGTTGPNTKTHNVYNGSQRVTAMIPYKEGVITGFSGGEIYVIEYGKHLGRKLYNWSQLASAMLL